MLLMGKTNGRKSSRSPNSCSCSDSPRGFAKNTQCPFQPTCSLAHRGLANSFSSVNFIIGSPMRN